MTLNEYIKWLIELRDNENAGEYKMMVPCIYWFDYVFKGKGMVDMDKEDVSINHINKACDISCHEDIR